MPGVSLMATQPGMRTSSATSSGLSASLVTQEVELVYWKDIKESDAIEDLQGFLDNFHRSFTLIWPVGGLKTWV